MPDTLPETTTSSRARLQPWTVALAGSVLFAACGHLLIKFGLNAAHRGAGLVNLWLLLGLAIYGLGTLFWILAVSRQKISYLYPMTALNYAVVAIGGQVLFQEMISRGRWLGIFTVIVGVGLMQWSQAREAE